MRLVERDEISYQLDLSDFVQWRTFWGIKDQGKELLFAQLNETSFFLDVGANIGEICLEAAKLMQPGGQVWAFEPMAINFENLEQNLSLNPALIKNVTLFPIALGEKDKQEIAFSHPREDNQGMMRVKAESMGDLVYEKAEMRSLDSLFEEKSVRQLDGIKIDVEGYEYQVLVGAKKILEQFRPWLFIEVDDQNLKDQGDSAVKLLTYLEKLGYSFVIAEHNKKIDSTYNFEACHFDILAKCLK